MNIYFAPLEGVTDVIYRRIHHDCFSGITKYFIPFVCPTQYKSFPPREFRAILPENNVGVPVVPQILTKYADHFLWAASEMANMGYTEVNLNLGCPSGTVTAKGKGSGMLREPVHLVEFLDEIYEKCPIKVSIKTRIGFASPDEWPGLLEIFARYPMSEFIIHPRTRTEFYNGQPHAELVADAFAQTNAPIVYNGELCNVSDCRDMENRYPKAAALMLGRGLISNPAIAQELAGGEKLTLAALRNFHDKLFDAYAAADWPVKAIIGRMHEIMHYVSCSFADCDKARKAIRKASTLAAYESAVNKLFSECEMRPEPGFTTFK